MIKFQLYHFENLFKSKLPEKRSYVASIRALGLRLPDCQDTNKKT